MDHVIDGFEQVLQNCKANEIPICFHKEVHCFFSLSGVGYIHCYLSSLYCHVSFFQPCVPGFCTALTTYKMPISLPTLIFITFLPYPIFIFWYWKVYRAVKMHNANISWQNANVEDVRVAKILFITVVGFVSLWLPAQIIYLVSYHSRLPRQLTFLATLFIFSSSFVNPFIYGFMNRSFRNEFKKCLILKTRQSVDMELSHRKSGPV